MYRLVCIFAVTTVVSVSEQVARFIRLSDGYTFMPVSGPLSQTRVATLKDCGTKATIEELKTSSVGSYIFSESSDPNCEVYGSMEYISYDRLLAQSPVPGTAWYVKILDDITYERKCAEQDVKRLVEALNATYAMTVTESATQTTVSRSTLAREACRPTNAEKEAAVYLENSPEMSIYSWQAQATVSCSCDLGTKNYWPTGETSKPSTNDVVTNPVDIFCSNMATACIFAEDGVTWTVGDAAPERLTLYPYCEAEAYGRIIKCSGNVILNQSVYYNSEGLVDVGHDSVYIKAAAISCSGCKNIRNYASFQCFLPEMSAPAVTQAEPTTTTNPTTTESTPRLTKATTTVAATTRTSTTTTPAQTTPTTKRTTTVKPTTKTTKKSTTPKRTSPTTPRPTTPLPKCAPAPDKSNHANIVLDYASPMTVTPLGAKATLSCGCTSNNVLAPGLRYEFWRMGAKSVTASKDMNGIKISCANKIKLCMLTESKQEWIAGSKPPDYVVLYPFCNERGGCHMWSAHYPKGSEIMSGGSRFVSTGPPGNQGDDPEYMKVDAVSCGGCARSAASNKIVCELA